MKLLSQRFWSILPTWNWKGYSKLNPHFLMLFYFLNLDSLLTIIDKNHNMCFSTMMMTKLSIKTVRKIQAQCEGQRKFTLLYTRLRPTERSVWERGGQRDTACTERVPPAHTYPALLQAFPGKHTDWSQAPCLLLFWNTALSNKSLTLETLERLPTL